MATVVIRRSWAEQVFRLPAPIARASCPLKRGLSRRQLPTLASSGCNGAAQLRGSRLGCCGTYVGDRCGGRVGINRGADRVYETCSTVKLHVSPGTMHSTLSTGPERELRLIVSSETERYYVARRTRLATGNNTRQPLNPQLPSPERAAIKVSDPVGAGRRLWPAGTPVRRIIGMVAYDVRTVYVVERRQCIDQPSVESTTTY